MRPERERERGGCIIHKWEKGCFFAAEWREETGYQLQNSGKLAGKHVTVSTYGPAAVFEWSVCVCVFLGLSCGGGRLSYGKQNLE